MKLHQLAENRDQGYDKNQSSDAAIKRRSARNKARRAMEKAGKVRKGDGKHVDHKRALSQGGTNSSGNLQVIDARENLSDGRAVSAANQRKSGKK